MPYALRISGKHHSELYRHLFPGDNKEAVALALCGRHESRDISLTLVHRLILIPYEECERGDDYIKWRTDRISPFLEEVEKHDLAVLKIHSHPGGYARFSRIDDVSDAEFLRTAFNWSDTNHFHCSAVMLPDGQVFGRALLKDGSMEPLDKVSIAGDQIRIWGPKTPDTILPGFAQRNLQVFGEATYAVVRGLRIGVLGCSGLGSPTIEQFYRLGVGKLVLVDPDKIEEKNLNRIIQSTLDDAKGERYKTEVMAGSIGRGGLATEVKYFSANLYDSMDALREFIQCDVIFGCVDSVEGRHLLSRLANFYLVPYYDMGVQLNADGQGGIDSISAMAHYIQPGKSSLLSRRAYTRESLEAEGLLRQDREEYEKRLRAGYITNAQVDRPAVLPINMLISGMAVIDLLNRLHERPFKEGAPAEYARMLMDYTSNCIENRHEDKFAIDAAAAAFSGRGDFIPFLRLTELGKL